MRRVLVFVLSIGLILGLTIAAVGAETIKIGAIFPLTGPLAPYGVDIINGLNFAVDQINAAGGVLGKQLEVVLSDSANAPDVATDAATRMIQLDGVVGIVGGLASGITIALAEVTSAAQVPQISPTSTDAGITGLADSDYVFRTCVSDALQAPELAGLARNLGYKKVATIYANNAYGKGLAALFEEAFEDEDHESVAMIAYEESQPSYRGEVEQALQASPDAINLIGYPEDGNKIISAAIEQGYEGEWIFPDGMKGAPVTPGLACPEEGPCSEQYLEGSFGTAPGSLEVGVRAEFDADFTAAYGELKGIPYHPQAYDAVVSFALAMQLAGEASGPAIQAKLRDVANAPGEEVTYGEFARALELIAQGVAINYQGVSGPIQWDENGDVTSGAIDIWAVKDCKVRTVYVIVVGN